MEKARTFLPCKQRQDLAWQRARLLEEESHRSKVVREPAPTTPSEPPDLAGRIKIMYWAIRECGGLDAAKDAFKRAVRSLEDE